MKFGIGQAVPRLEDDRLLRGAGAFTDDLRREGQAFGVVVRAPFAHGTITRLDLQAARAAPGVLLALGADDLTDLGPLPCVALVPGSDGKPPAAPARHVLASGTARHMGEPIAFIVAETLEQARDGAELVELEFELLAAVTGTEEAVGDGAPEVCPEAPGNVSFDWNVGDKAATEAAFGAAERTVSMRLVNNRVIVNAIEPRAALATYSDADGFTLFTGTQGVWGVRATLAGKVFKIPKERLRVVSPDVGGGFGMKGFSYPEYALVMVAARRLGRPVKWTAERAESFVSDSHGRDVVSTVELAFDAEHRITGYRVDSIANLGAYLSEFGPYVPTMAATQILGGVYDIPNVYVRVRSVLTNTPPVDAYRGAGRPEAMHMMECAIDQAARELGISPDELRRINFIRPGQLPYKTALGANFDSGAFQVNMDMAMKNAGWAGLKARREGSAAGGRLRGIGMGYYIESTLGMPSEEVELVFSDEGRLTLFVGTQSTGQGHWTTFGQILAERLGLELSEIDMVEGDTARKERGFGTGGSRSLQMVGNAVLTASDEMIAKGLPAASELLSVPEEELKFEDGLYRAGSSNLTVGLAELARRLAEPDAETGDRAEGLASSATYTKSGPTFPNGCHIAEVEIDRETGGVTLQAYTIVDDFGTVINPLVVEGQVHGGVAQGIGQALTEHCVFDGDDGTLLSGTLLDYGLPRADDLPNFDFTINSVPCTTNPLGMKGCGEAGTVGALPAVMNAVNDALASAGLGPIDMPATPFRVWSHLNRV